MIGAPFDPFQGARVQKIDPAMRLYQRWLDSDKAVREAGERRSELEEAYRAKAGWPPEVWIIDEPHPWRVGYNEVCGAAKAEEERLEELEWDLLQEVLALPATPSGIQVKLLLALKFTPHGDLTDLQFDCVRAALADAERLAGGTQQ